MAESVCPWWIGYLLASPIRKLVQHPHALLSPYVRPGMTVLEPGPGMGFFTLELARLVGEGGRVLAVDVQERMLASLRRRAGRAGLADRIEARLAAPETMGLADVAGAVDFVLAFAMVHEFPDPARFFGECAAAMKPGARMLLAEPAGHVGGTGFARELELAAAAGLTPLERPRVWHSHAAVLSKS